MTSANKSLEKKNFHQVENVIKQLVHTSCVRSSRYEALGKFKEHSRTNEPIVKWTRYKTRHAVIFKTHASRISQMRKKLNRAIFKWESMVIRDCFAFSSLRLWWVQKNSRHFLNQSGAKLKTWSPAFSRALDSLVISSNWTLWLTWFHFYETQSKSAPMMPTE